jgi:hypothetical protein
VFPRRIRTIDQLERELGHPVLGTLPHLRVRSTGVSTLAGDSDRARAARALTAHIAVLEGSSLLVSAPSEGHGRSVVVANIAVGLAERGDATLALDFDDDGQLGRLLGAAAAPDGDVVPVRTSLDYCVARDGTGDWTAYARVIGNGHTVDDPSFPPLASRFDGVLLVVRAGTLGGADVERLLASLNGTALVGAVLTDAGDERLAPRRREVARPTEELHRVAKQRVDLTAREAALAERERQLAERAADLEERELELEDRIAALDRHEEEPEPAPEPVPPPAADAPPAWQSS